MQVGSCCCGPFPHICLSARFLTVQQIMFILFFTATNDRGMYLDSLTLHYKHGIPHVIKRSNVYEDVVALYWVKGFHGDQYCIAITALALQVSVAIFVFCVIHKRKQSLHSLHHGSAAIAKDGHPIYEEVSPIEIPQWHAEAVHSGKITVDEDYLSVWLPIIDSHSIPVEADSTILSFHSSRGWFHYTLISFQ